MLKTNLDLFPKTNQPLRVLLAPLPATPAKQMRQLPCFVLLLVLLSGLFPVLVFGNDQPDDNRIDAALTKTLLKMDDYSWDALGDETIPLQQQYDEVLELLYQLVRVVPPSFLKNVKPLPTFSALVEDPAQFRGLAFELKGHVVMVEEKPLNPAEKKRFRIPSVFSCRFRVDESHFAEILTAFVPADWKKNVPINERAAVTGIYIKRLAPDDSGFVPLLVAPRIRWFPDTFLGNLGFDVGSFDQVPPLRVTDLKKKKFDVAPSLQLLGRNEILQRAFKFTEADREPFYGLLHAASQSAPGQIRLEAQQLLEKEGKQQNSVINLFNSPDTTRGKPVLLHGIAKRVLPTLVEDKEVKALFGIEKYYQIYFYTDDSQGNPLVACVMSLPDGMPVGAAPDYAEEITIAVIPYKLWVYETSAKLEEGAGYKPNYAPLLIGRSPNWRQKKTQNKPPAANNEIQHTRTTISLTLFCLLLLVWIIIKRQRRS
ncbi:MAG: hypothetical protein LBQ50_08765 [Planctomycetaceae bacterium]|jgi:hypothetical protein|nr:hypothetical protein [Planctomycetaceae bacterium]